MELIYLEDKIDGNPMCQCPECGHKARLMEGFSLLSYGFNGVEKGSDEDIDKQECGQCSTILDW